jgi:hypothetical protein
VRWPFRRRTPPRADSVRLGDLPTDPSDFSVLTVGQSRLLDSFDSLGITAESQPRVDFAVLTPIVDPTLQLIADITVSVDGQVVGYLRPPDLRQASALMDEHHVAALQVPCRIFWSPAGPEVNLRLP